MRAPEGRPEARTSALGRWSRPFNKRCPSAFFNSYLSWFTFLYPFMLEMPALSTAFEQLCECFRLCASSGLPLPAPPAPCLLRRNAPNRRCQRLRFDELPPSDEESPAPAAPAPAGRSLALAPAEYTVVALLWLAVGLPLLASVADDEDGMARVGRPPAPAAGADTVSTWISSSSAELEVVPPPAIAVALFCLRKSDVRETMVEAGDGGSSTESSRCISISSCSSFLITHAS